MVQGCGACPGTCYTNSNFTESLSGCTLTATDPDAAEGYHWDFGDGSTASGPNVSHDYIFGGTFDVCLTVSCGLETNSTMCKTITIQEECDQCQYLEKKIQAARCEAPEEGQPDTYLANFSFTVPKGYGPCKEGNLYVSSWDVAMTVTSFEVDESDPNHDLITVAVVVVPPLGYDVSQGATGHVTLCTEEGPMICYNFSIEFSTCHACYEEINTFAVCDPELAQGNLFFYEGMVLLDFLPAFFVECDHITTETGLVLDIGHNGNEWVVSYSLSTTEQVYANIKLLLCFEDPDENKHCVPMDIAIEPCTTDPPLECVEAWAEKPMDCEEVVNGWTVFDFPPMQFPTPQYHLCDGELTGSIQGGGVVVVNSASIVNGQFSFDVDIHMPPGFVPGEVYELRLYLCDFEGNVVCFLFPLRLFCDELGGGGGGGLRPVVPGSGSGTSVAAVTVAPNPADQRVVVTVKGADVGTGHEARLYDTMGRLVGSRQLTSASTVIPTAALPPGIYYVSVSEHGTRLLVERMAVVR